jgi:hypothetical protein
VRVEIQENFRDAAARFRMGLPVFRGYQRPFLAIAPVEVAR